MTTRTGETPATGVPPAGGRPTPLRPGVSVVIPNYNHTRFVRDAIESVLAQTEPALEIVVVDDGSTDDCREVVTAYGPAVTYVHQANQGLAGARNTGIRAARGELVGLLDADDRWAPSFIASAVARALASPDAAVYYCCAQAMDEAGQELPQVLGGPPVPSARLYDRLLRANFLIPSTVVLRREPIVEAGLFDSTLRSCEDWDLWLRLLPTRTFVGSDETLVSYRVHGSSLSGNAENMREASRLVVEKRFGPDAGDWNTWRPEKRRAYGGLYRYYVLTYVQRQGNWDAAVPHAARALRIDPTLATDLDFFYDLALGRQPVGRRGSASELALAENAAELDRLLWAVEALAERHRDLEAPVSTARATAWHALGLLSYNTGAFSMSRHYLWKALARRPALFADRVLVGDLGKSFVKPVLRAWRATRAEQAPRS
ncbi:MAG: glycosyltransferase [Vicinamibacterales bacterium]